MEFIQSIIDHEKDLIHALRDGADENRQAELDSMLRKFKEIEKSDLTAFFDDMNLIKNDYPKLLVLVLIGQIKKLLETLLPREKIQNIMQRRITQSKILKRRCRSLNM